MDLGELRERLTRLDGELLALIAERQRLSEEVARAKRATGHPTRDFQREREVLHERARRPPEKLGLSPALADNLLRLLIRSSLATQEQAQVAAQGQGAGRRALVIGGARQDGPLVRRVPRVPGLRGRGRGPGGPLGTRTHRADWQSDELSHEVIVVATPLGITAVDPRAARAPPAAGPRVRHRLAEDAAARGPRGAAARRACASPRCIRCSGPTPTCCRAATSSTWTWAAPDAVADAQSLFASTMVEQVVTTLDDHDRLIAYVLGLSHAINIAFFTALAESGEAAPRLARLSSTTFDAQLAVASLVAGRKSRRCTSRSRRSTSTAANRWRPWSRRSRGCSRWWRTRMPRALPASCAVARPTCRTVPPPARPDMLNESHSH